MLSSQQTHYYTSQTSQEIILCTPLEDNLARKTEQYPPFMLLGDNLAEQVVLKTEAQLN